MARMKRPKEKRANRNRASRWGNKRTGLTQAELDMKIKKFDAMAKRLNNLIQEVELKERQEQTAIQNNQEQALTKKEQYRKLVTSQRDRRLVLAVLIIIEEKSYDELEHEYGYGTNTISSMHKAIKSDTIHEAIEGGKSKEELKHGNALPEAVLDEIVTFVESKCETYPLWKRGYSHYLRGANTTILSLYHEFVEKMNCEGKQQYLICQSAFYEFFKCNLSYVEIPSAGTEFCSRCATFKSTDLDTIDQTHGTTLREQFTEHLNKAHNAMSIYNNLHYHRSNDEIVIAFDFKSSILLPLVKKPISSSNYAKKNKVEVLGIIIKNRKYKPQVYLFDEYDSVTKKEMIFHAISDLCIKLKNEYKFHRLMFFADNTVAQNKNKFMLCFMEALRQTFELISVRFSFLEVGHTHNDVDMLFGQMTTVLRQVDQYCIEDIQNELNSSEIAECTVVLNQNNFNVLVQQAKQIKNITTFQTFIFEEGVVYGSTEMLGQQSQNEKRKALCRYGTLARECNIRILMHENNKVLNKELTKEGLIAFSNTLNLFPSRTERITDIYERRFIDLIEDESFVIEHFTDNLLKVPIKDAKKIMKREKKEKKK